MVPPCVLVEGLAVRRELDVRAVVLLHDEDLPGLELLPEVPEEILPDLARLFRAVL